MSQSLRSLLVLLVGGVAVVFAANQIVRSPAFHIPKDFLEYWASARLNLRGENPYDPARLLAEQRTADSERDKAVMMWNPPSALAVYAPLAPVQPRWAALFWIALQLFAVMLACDLLWRVYAPGQKRGLAQLVGLSFVGTWWVVAYGQNAGLLALGLAGFLYYTRKGKPVAAGAFAALTALKPHLLAGFGVLFIADSLARRGRSSLAAGTLVVFAALCFAMLTNPNVVSQFIAAEAILTRRDSAPRLDAAGAELLASDETAPDQFWVQFVPRTIASITLFLWRLRAGESWTTRARPWSSRSRSWRRLYGGWIFDLPVLLVPVIWCAAKPRTRAPSRFSSRDRSRSLRSRSPHPAVCTNTGGSRQPCRALSLRSP